MSKKTLSSDKAEVPALAVILLVAMVLIAGITANYLLLNEAKSQKTDLQIKDQSIDISKNTNGNYVLEVTHLVGDKIPKNNLDFRIKHNENGNKWKPISWIKDIGTNGKPEYGEIVPANLKGPDRVEKIESQLQDLKKQKKELEDTISSHKSKIKELEKTLEHKEVQLDKAKRELEQAKKKLKRFKRLLEELESDDEETPREKELRKKINYLEQERIPKLEDKKQTLKETIEEIETQLNELETSLPEKKEDLQELEPKIKEFEEKLRKAKQGTKNVYTGIKDIDHGSQEEWSGGSSIKFIV